MYFDFGSRKEQIIFTRLRPKCSSLKDHLLKNIIDSGLCTCEKNLYLLQCPNHIFIRNETIHKLGTFDV
jgi:hypothetical protein